MKVGLLTREYPPEVYGGAGVHVEHLARALAYEVEVAVHCAGGPRNDRLVASTSNPWEALSGESSHRGALGWFSVSLAQAAAAEASDIVHSHTWYANLGGHLAKLTYDIPHVVTSHSLEPLRPWKAEQLGGGYALSSFAERTAIEGADAVIAVSSGMRDDVLACYPGVDPDRIEVIHNGIDAEAYRPIDDPTVLARHDIHPDLPTVTFVGRITRQKGVPHLLDAARHLPAGTQLILCAGQPDTPEIGREVVERVERLRADGHVRVVWIDHMLPRTEIVALLSAADVFACPSVYEPFGLVNVEAMATGTAVVASAVGGIPEIIVEGETGHLVPFEAGDDAYGTPRDPEAFARDLAAGLSPLLTDRDRAAAMGAAGRERVVEHFAWEAIAARTAELYRRLLA